MSRCSPLLSPLLMLSFFGVDAAVAREAAPTTELLVLEFEAEPNAPYLLLPRLGNEIHGIVWVSGQVPPSGVVHVDLPPTVQVPDDLSFVAITRSLAGRTLQMMYVWPSPTNPSGQFVPFPSPFEWDQIPDRFDLVQFDVLDVESPAGQDFSSSNGGFRNLNSEGTHYFGGSQWSGLSYFEWRSIPNELMVIDNLVVRIGGSLQSIRFDQHGQGPFNSYVENGIRITSPQNQILIWDHAGDTTLDLANWNLT
jgi:hypothetical protein